MQIAYHSKLFNQNGTSRSTWQETTKKKGLIQSLCLAEDIPSMKYSTAVSMHVV